MKEENKIQKNQNFLSVDGKTARNSYGNYFIVGQTVKNEDVDVGEAIITGFELDKEYNEVKAHTNKGYAHIDFIHEI